MSRLPLLTEAQTRQIKPFFPVSRELHRVDDRRTISGIIYVIRPGLQWKDAPRGYGPHKTFYRQHPPQGAPHAASLAQKGALRTELDAPAAA